MRNAKYLIANATGIPSLVNFLNRRKLLVLAYHGIYDGPRRSGALPETFVHVDDLKAQLSAIKRKYTVIDPEALKNQLLNGSSLPSQAALITFDDGYESFYRLAWPVLKSLGIRPIIFVTTRNLENNLPFWFDLVWLFMNLSSDDDARRLMDKLDLRRNGSVAHDEIPAVLRKMKTLMPEHRDDIAAVIMASLLQKSDESLKTIFRHIFAMDSKQLRDAAEEGVTIGGHTHTHTILTRLSDSEAEKDIMANKAKIESWIGRQCDFFAYPNGGNGDFDTTHKGILEKLGFLGAFSLTQRRSKPVLDPMAISRINVAPEDTPQSLLFRCVGIVPIVDRLRGA